MSLLGASVARPPDSNDADHLRAGVISLEAIEHLAAKTAQSTGPEGGTGPGQAAATTTLQPSRSRGL